MGEWTDKFNKGKKKAFQDASMMDNAPSVMDFKQMLKNSDNPEEKGKKLDEELAEKQREVEDVSIILKIVKDDSVYVEEEDHEQVHQNWWEEIKLKGDPFNVSGLDNIDINLDDQPKRIELGRIDDTFIFYNYS